MTRERQRIHLAPGLAVYREFLMWQLDVTIGGQRIRESLHTQSLPQAILLAHQALEEKSPAFRALPRPVRQSDGTIDVTSTIGVERHVLIAGGLTQYYPNAEDLAQSLAPLVAREMKQALQDDKPKAVAVEFSEAVDQYLAYQTGEQNERDWLQNIRSTLTGFGRKMNLKTVDQITGDLLAKYKGYLVDPKLEPEPDPNAKRLGNSRIRQIVGIVKKFCKWMVEVKKYLPEDPSGVIEQKKASRIPAEFFSAEEVAKLLDGAPDPETAAALATAVYAGPRREELFFLEWDDVDLEGRTISIHNRDEKSTKTGVNRQTPILDELFPFLYALPRGKGRVFVRYTHVDPFGDNILRFCERLTGRVKVGLQVARHTALTWWIKHGISVGTASDWAGNSPRVVEEHYRGRVPLGAPNLSMTYFGRGLLQVGIPEVTQAERASWNKAFEDSIRGGMSPRPG